MSSIIRLAHGTDDNDARAIQRIYAPFVRDTAVSFELALPGAGFGGFFTSLFCKAAADDGGGEEGKEGEPVLGVVDGEGADGWEEVVVVKDRGGEGDGDGVTQAPAGGKREERAASGSVVSFERSSSRSASAQ